MKENQREITNSLGRRQLLRKAGATGVVGTVGLGAAAGTALADDPITEQNELFRDTVSVPNTDIEVEHALSITERTGACISGDYIQAFELAINTRAYDENDPSTPKDEAILANMWEMEWDESKGNVNIESDDPYEWGGYPYAEDDGDDYSDFAASAMEFGVSTLAGSYGWAVGTGTLLLDMLRYIGEATDQTDRIRNDFVYYDPWRDPAGHLVPQADCWGTFVCEIDNTDYLGAGLSIDFTTGFTIERGYDDFVYRDTDTYRIDGDDYCS